MGKAAGCTAGGGGGGEDLHGNFVDGTEVGAVIQPEIRGRVHGQGVQVIETGQFIDGVFMDGLLEHSD